MFLCAGFVVGNYARVLSGPHKGLQGKVGMHTHVHVYYDVYVLVGICISPDQSFDDQFSTTNLDPSQCPILGHTCACTIYMYM